MHQILGFLTFFFIIHVASGQSKTVLVTSIANPSTDSIEVKVEDNDIIWKWETYNLVLKNGRNDGNLPIRKPSFFYLKEGRNYIYGFIEPGDSVVIQYDATKMSETLSFEGRKKNALQVYNQFVQFKLRDKLKAQLPIAKQKPYPFDHLLHWLDSLESKYLKRLSTDRQALSSEATTALTGYVRAQFLSSRYHAVTLVHSESAEKTIDTRAEELTQYSLQKIKTIRQFDEKYRGVSAYVNAVYGILFRYYDGLQLEGKADKSIPKKFAYLNSQLQPKLKVPVLTMFIEFEMGRTNDANEIKSIIDKYFTNPADETYNSYVNTKFQSLVALKKGLPAPAFTLTNEKGEVVSLENLKNKVVYMDFWFASCVPCHALFRQLKPVKEHFTNDPQVVFLTVSVDTETLWKESLQKFQIEGFHVFTQNKGRDHAIIKDYKVFQYPTTYLIDKNGNIYSASPPDNPMELISQIEQMLKQ